MRIRSKSILTLVLCMTLAASLLPTRWLGWTGDAADIARIPIMPLATIGNRLAGALRPVNVRRGMFGGADLLQIESERDHLERLLLAEQMRAAELEQQLRQLQALPESAYTAGPPLLVRTEVTGRRPDLPMSGVELHLTPEAVGRVQVGDAVTWDGRWLVGRITRVSSLGLSALPITHPDIGPLVAVVIPDGGSVDLRHAPRALLRQDGRGGLVAEIDRRAGVGVGDRLVLADASWPASLQGFHLGVVDSVSDVDEAPLRRRLKVRPEVQLYELPWVVLVAPPSALPASGEGDPR